MSNIDKSIQSDSQTTNTSGVDAPVLIVRDALGNQVIALQSDQALSFAAVTGEHYRLLTHSTEGKENLLDDLIAVQQGADLVITYAQGTQLTIDGYFDLCVAETAEEPDTMQCSATVAGDDKAGHVIQGTANGAGVNASSPSIVYAHGEQQELLAIINGNAADELLLTTYFAGVVEPAAAAFALPGLLGGLGGAAALAAAGGVSGADVLVAVANVNDIGTIAAITGTAKQGEVLTAGEISDLDGTEGGEFVAATYQWQADGTAIAGANGSTYTLTQAEVGQELRVVATYTDAQGTQETVTSAPTKAVANANIAGRIAAISSSFANDASTWLWDDRLLTAGKILDEDGTEGGEFVAATYKWHANGRVIAGATEATYTLTKDRAKEEITLVATYTDAEGKVETVKSAPTEFFRSRIIEMAEDDSAEKTGQFKIGILRLMGITGMNAWHLKPIQSTLDSELVDGAAVNTLEKIQAVLDFWSAILKTPITSNPTTSPPPNLTLSDFTNVGVKGLDGLGEEAQSLLIDSVNILSKKSNDLVNKVPLLQALADAVIGVMDGISGVTGKPTLLDLKYLGITGATEANIAAIHTAIAATDGDGARVDSLAEIQALEPPEVSLPGRGSTTNNNTETIQYVNDVLLTSYAMAEVSDAYSGIARLKMTDLVAMPDAFAFDDWPELSNEVMVTGLTDAASLPNVSDLNTNVYAADDTNTGLWLNPEVLLTSVI
jgi:hypothetical protein